MIINLQIHQMIYYEILLIVMSKFGALPYLCGLQPLDHVNPASYS